jgi:hypothetical protein
MKFKVVINVYIMKKKFPRKITLAIIEIIAAVFAYSKKV